MKRHFYARYALLILMIVAFLMPFMWVGTKWSLQSNKNDVKSWLPEGYRETTEFQWYRQHFESDMFILASWDGCTLHSSALELLARKLVPTEASPNPLKADIPFFKHAMTGTQLVAELVEKQGLTEEEAIERLKGFVVGPDGKQTCLVLSVAQESEELWDAERRKERRPRPKFLHAVVNRVYDVAKRDCDIPPEELHLGGPPVDNAAIDTEGERSLFRLAGFSGVVGLFMAWWCLRSWRLTAMVFTSALFTAGLSLLAVWRFGFGPNMNAILLTMPSLAYVAAVSGAIHLANYYRDTVREHGFEGAPDRTVAAAWIPLALATGTTAIGLMSMCITDLVPIRMFGLYSAVGVVIGFFVVLFYMPSLLQQFPLRNILAPSRIGIVDPGLSPKWRHVGDFVIRHHGLVTAACVLIMGLGVWGVTKTETSVKLMRLFSRDARILADYAWLEKRLGPLVPMEVVVKVDTSQCKLDVLDRMRMVNQVRQVISTLPDVGSTLAAPTFARSLPQRPGFLERRTWIVQLEKHRKELKDYLKTDGDEELWRVSARVAALTNTDYGEFVKDIQAAVEPVLDTYRDRGVTGVSAVYTGLVPLIYKAQSSMLDGLIYNFVGDLILIGVAMMFLTREWSSGLLLMFPCLFPMAIIFGVMGWMGQVVDVGTVMTPAVALGVTVDDAIHFMLWCRHGQERGMSRAESIMFAYKDCARAIYQSWGVIGLGLFSFAFSAFTPTQRFGYLMFAMLTASSIGNLVLLPALLAGPLGNRFWRKGKVTHPPVEPAAPAEPAQPAEPAVAFAAPKAKLARIDELGEDIIAIPARRHRRSGRQA